MTRSNVLTMSAGSAALLSAVGVETVLQHKGFDNFAFALIFLAGAAIVGRTVHARAAQTVQLQAKTEALEREQGVQRRVTVVVQFADRDVQPVPGTDSPDRIGLQADQFADPKPGADQHFTNDADQQPALRGGGAQEPRGGRVVEGLGQRVVLAWQIPATIETRPGASAQPHSSMRMKNIRNVPSRYRCGPGPRSFSVVRCGTRRPSRHRFRRRPGSAPRRHPS